MRTKILVRKSRYLNELLAPLLYANILNRNVS